MKNKMKNKTKDMQNSYDKKKDGCSCEQTSDCGYSKDCHTGRKTK